MNVKQILPITMGVIVLSLSACSTYAPDQANPLADVPPPSEVRFISFDDATSECIGNPKTPLCAVETLLSCFARSELSLCKRLGITKVELPPFNGMEKYKIISAKVMTEDDAKREDLLEEPSSPPEWWTPNTIEIIVSKPDGDDNKCHLTNCRFIDSAPPVGDDCCKYTYIINPVDHEWRVISWWWWGEY